MSNQRATRGVRHAVPSEEPFHKVGMCQAAFYREIQSNLLAGRIPAWVCSRQRAGQEVAGSGQGPGVTLVLESTPGGDSSATTEGIWRGSNSARIGVGVSGGNGELGLRDRAPQQPQGERTRLRGGIICHAPSYEVQHVSGLRAPGAG